MKGPSITDMFCGCGGSSTGAQKAGGEIKLALNHWKLAIETHNTNFQKTDHDCTDVSAADPRRYNKTDMLLASPECPNHSLAKGQKIVKAQIDLYEKQILDPAAERSRATMWDVPRFAEVHNYKLIIVENVADVRKWRMFDAWLMAMHSLGYKHQSVFANSMFFHPTPQSRDRIYIVFWKAKNRKPKLDFTPSAYCHTCNENISAVQTWKKHDVNFGKYKQQYIYCCPKCAKQVYPYYYAAFNCIDWTNIGKRIGDRKKALSPNTIKRIEYGLKKYGNQMLQVTNKTPGFCAPLSKASGTMQTVNSYGLLHPPFIVNSRHTSGLEHRVKGIEEPIGCQTADVSHTLVTPFIIKEEHSQALQNAVSIEESLKTQTCRQSMALVVPWIIEMNRTGEMKPASEPTGTFTSGGINHGMLQHFISYYFGTSQASHITEPLGTTRTTDSYQLINYQVPKIDDCYYRMLKSGEVGRAMAFEDSYIVLGNEKDKVKQYGNAVTPPVMQWLVERCIESLQQRYDL